MPRACAVAPGVGRHTVVVTSGSFLGFDLAAALPAGFGILYGADTGMVRMPGCHPAYNRFKALAGDAPGSIGYEWVWAWLSDEARHTLSCGLLRSFPLFFSPPPPPHSLVSPRSDGSV